MKRFLPILLCGLLYIGCDVYEEPVYNNPIDPLSPDFTLPKAKLSSSFVSNTVLSETWVSFNWDGIYTNSTFSFRLVGCEENYCSWTSEKTFTYNHLDEGEYTFLVKEKAGDFEQEIPDSVTFTIDAVRQSALVLKKWYSKVGSGEIFFVDVCIENMTNLNGLSTKLNFSKEQLELTQIESLKENINSDAESVFFIANNVSEANTSGIIELDLLLLGNEKAIFTGNAAICRLYFTTKSNTEATIDFDSENTKLRDASNKDIDLQMLRGAVIN